MSTVPSNAPDRSVRGRRPLALAAWGLLLVGLDLRLNGFDVLPDVVGWVLLLVAPLRLMEVVPAGSSVPTDREPGRRRLAVLTAVAALVSFLLSLPGVTVTGLPLVVVVPMLTVALLLRLVTVQATHGGDTVSAARWQWLFGLWCAASGTLVAVGLLPSGPVIGLGSMLPPGDSVAAAGAVVVTVVVVAALVLLVTGVVAVVRLFKDSWRPWARPMPVTVV